MTAQELVDTLIRQPPGTLVSGRGFDRILTTEDIIALEAIRDAMADDPQLSIATLYADSPDSVRWWLDTLQRAEATFARAPRPQDLAQAAPRRGGR